jgi:hypothetical protein
MMLLGTSSKLDPECLILLQAVFNNCCKKLSRTHGRVSDRAQVRIKRELVAARIMALAEKGVSNPDQLEKQALAGLLPRYPH